MLVLVPAVGTAVMVGMGWFWAAVVADVSGTTEVVDSTVLAAFPRVLVVMVELMVQVRLMLRATGVKYWLAYSSYNTGMAVQGSIDPLKMAGNSFLSTP